MRTKAEFLYRSGSATFADLYRLPMKIMGPENISAVFSIFHDGEIAQCVLKSNSLWMEVEIEYLAKRINKNYKAFVVRLHEVDQVRFSPWSNAANKSIEILADPKIIFEQDLEILGSSFRDGEIRIVCNQYSQNYDYIGGELYLRAESAEVNDEAGKSYSLEELDELCKGYWDDWANKRKA
jgi:hypothetical protein